MSSKQRLILLIIVVLAFILRAYSLTDVPSGLNQDEAVSGYDAYSISTNLHDHKGNFMPIAFESFGDYTSPILTYLLVPFVKVMGLNMLSIRLPVALLGTLSVLLIFRISLKIIDNINVALVGALLLCLMPWSISLSRWSIPPNIVVFFLLLSILWLFEAVNDQRKYKYILFGITFGLLTYTYPTLKLFVPLMAVSIIYILLRNKVQKKYILISFATTILIALPILIMTILNGSKYNSRFNEISILSLNMPVIEFIKRYIEYFTPNFLFGFGDSNIMQHIPRFGLIYGIFGFLFYPGVMLIIYKLYQGTVLKEKMCLQILLSWLVIFPIPASLTRDYDQTLRVVHGLPLIIIIICYFFNFVLNNVGFKRLWLNIFVIFIFFNSILFINFYFNTYPNLSRVGFQYGTKQIYEYLLAHESEFDGVNVDQMYNNSYIYYLFYSKYNPNHLDYQAINAITGDKDYWDGVHVLGKYKFKYITDDLSSYKNIFEIKDGKKVFARIYAKDRNFIVKRIL